MHNTATQSVQVLVRLNALGRAVTATPGGYAVQIAITTVPATGSTLRASVDSRIVMNTFTVPRSVYFSSSSSAVSKAQRTYLAGLRRKLPGVRTVTCTGFTDDQGSKAAALTLGRKRAQQVCDAVAHNLKGVRVVIVTKGMANPKGNNNTKAGMAQNRRADITLRY